jgi:nicotinamidase-related amidase
LEITMHRKILVSAILLATLAGGVAMATGQAGNQSRNQAQAQRQDGPQRPTTWGPNGSRERLTPDNCVFAFIDHQTGLMNIVDNARPTEFKNMVVGLAQTAKIHGVPSIITTSAEDGANGPFMPEVLAILPDAPRIPRPGQINAWDNAEFVKAVEATGRKKIVMSGITTDVCVAFAALSALDAGYEVYVVVDASGSMNRDTQAAAIMRMSEAGAQIGTWFAISCELLSDWRNPEGQATAQLFIDHMPSYAEVFHSHQAQQGSR